MAVAVIVGSQWGDEGKGKLTHYMSPHYEVTLRFQGGSNAGHTVITGGRTFKFNLLPSAILHAGRTCIMGDGMVVNPAHLIEEIALLQKGGFWQDNLRVGSRAHLVLPYHILLDELEEKRRGGSSIGTTKQGIGPCYADKYARIGVLAGDLLKPDVLHKRLEVVVPVKNALLRGLYQYEPLIDLEALYEELLEQGKVIGPYIADTAAIVREHIDAGHSILCEGAQGALLDIDYGTYPFVTSSHPVTAGACLGTGIAPGDISRVIGVSKAYTTRVGNGSFPTELTDATGEHLRERGLEYGTTTGRPRRCGWIDLVLLRHALRINGASELAITKIDVLDDLPTVKACVAYRRKGEIVTRTGLADAELAQCEPVYEEFSGWKGPIREVRSESELPAELTSFVDFMEKQLGVPITVLSLGPDHDETVSRQPKL
ncbi:MAG: adenylosuccinate synthase [Planctomycetales bacterium 4484_113]|nr:MAG: adenylosuccinate synthase [Planctomycetales bacterium 4484_113]